MGFSKSWNPSGSFRFPIVPEHLWVVFENFLEKSPLTDSAKIAKAFATYFELTNLAETNHRKRRRRASQLNPDISVQPGTFHGTLQRLKAAGIPLESVLETLRVIEVTPVFTAHPTEVARRTILWSRQRIARLLEALDVLPLSNSHAAKIETEIAGEITLLWQTDEVRTGGSNCI